MVEKVGYTRAAGAPRPVRRTGSVDGSVFADALGKAEAAAAGGVEAPVTAAPIGSVGLLLGAQEVDDREMERRKSMKRGRATLDMLTQLRDGLLMGSLPLSTIRNLQQLVEQERAAVILDPGLKDILDQIELRAAVEVAKLEAAGLI